MRAAVVRPLLRAEIGRGWTGNVLSLHERALETSRNGNQGAILRDKLRFIIMPRKP